MAEALIVFGVVCLLLIVYVYVYDPETGMVATTVSPTIIWTLVIAKVPGVTDAVIV